MFDQTQIPEIAGQILTSHPNAIVKFRLLRDVLRLDPATPDLCAAREGLASHPRIKELAAGQLPGGSWERFHSQDSKVKSPFPTSETAIRRALALGLDNHDPVLASAVQYMENVLSGKTVWSDRVEKSEGWPICVEAITAGTLAQVDPADPALRQPWEYWLKIASLSFPGGAYDPEAEWRTHKEVRGLGAKYLGSRYVLALLGARSADLPPSLDRQLVDWVWNNPAGIGYLGADLQHPEPFHIFNWLESMEILSLFRSSREVAAAALAWLWSQRNAEGLWDFGAGVSKSFYFPLSDDWRKAGNRSIDHSTRVLALLRK